MGARYGLIMRSTGEAVPVRIQLSESPPQARTGAPRFALVIERCVTTESLVLADAIDGRVRSGNSGALDAMGVTALQLRSESLRLQDLVRSFRRGGDTQSGLVFNAPGAASSSDSAAAVTGAKTRLTFAQLRQAIELAHGWSLFGASSAMVHVDTSESEHTKYGGGKGATAARGTASAVAVERPSRSIEHIHSGLAHMASKSHMRLEETSKDKSVVEIQCPRNLSSILGRCGIVVLDTSTGRELALMRAQQCTMHGVSFILVGWTTLETISGQRQVEEGLSSGIRALQGDADSVGSDQVGYGSDSAGSQRKDRNLRPYFDQTVEAPVTDALDADLLAIGRVEDSTAIRKRGSSDGEGDSDASSIASNREAGTVHEATGSLESDGPEGPSGSLTSGSAKTDASKAHDVATPAQTLAFAAVDAVPDVVPQGILSPGLDPTTLSISARNPKELVGTPAHESKPAFQPELELNRDLRSDREAAEKGGTQRDRAGNAWIAVSAKKTSKPASRHGSKDDNQRSDGISARYGT